MIGKRTIGGALAVIVLSAVLVATASSSGSKRAGRRATSLPERGA